MKTGNSRSSAKKSRKSKQTVSDDHLLEPLFAPLQDQQELSLLNSDTTAAKQRQLPESSSPTSALLQTAQQPRIKLWQAGLLKLRLPDGVQPRSLTPAEKHWLDRAAAAEYINPEQNGQKAIFYTSAPPDFRLEAANWYLCSNDYRNQHPILLQEIMARFPAELFKLSASGQPPAFYPDRTPDYSNEQETVMRSIFRETVRLGWSLPQYKWLVMEQFHKTTAQVTFEEAKQILEILQTLTDVSF